MEFLFRHRGAGKRQVKPSQDIALLEDQIGAESSDDSEYKIGSDNEHSNDESDDGGDKESSSSSNNSDDEGGPEGDADDDDDEESKGEVAALKNTDDHESLTTRDLLALARKELDHYELPKWVGKVKICGCCLGQVSTDANEIVECDGCGVSVHEGCYGITESAGSVASTVSSASTEPWFCEPCRAGMETSPSCELCPLIGGVYKQTDVGRWVHLVCALYVPGVAFGDTENMTKVTIFEMNYVSWGRRVCSICSASPYESEVSGGVRLSRTGVIIQCDAGLCKSYFHVSCAQAAGLLSEPSYVMANNVTHTAEAVMDAYLAHCKVHSDRTTVKRRRRAYLIHLVQSRLRKMSIKARQKLTKSEEVETADERILRKLARSQVHYKADKARAHEPWVPTQKLPRLLTTSASAIRKIQRLGEIHGVDIDRQMRQEVQVMSIIEAKKKWGISPAFSVEFVAYYEDRERRIKSLRKVISQDKRDFTQLRNEESEVTLQYDKLSKILSEARQSNSNLRKKVDSCRSLLSLGGIDLPKTVAAVISSKGSPTPMSSLSMKPRSTAYSSHLSNQDSSRHLKTCGICTKSHDQHLLAHCDTCQLHYHLGCLTPPLTRMPKKSKQYGWSCSECYPDSSGDELKAEIMDFDDDQSGDGINRRRRQRRVAASKALLAASSSANNSEDEANIMKKVMKESAKMAKVSKSETILKNGDNDKDMIAKAEAKAERKRIRKEEKARRKAEKKAEKQRLIEQNGDDSDVEIIEEDNGVCTVSIGPKPIKLTIKTNGHQPKKMSTPPAAIKSKDVRSKCDKCQEPGDNVSLVRCDECKRCYHFGCLIPPLKKSPKVPGYGWHCNECDPSDRDSDWHLD